MDSADIVCQFLHCLVVTSITLRISMASRETMDTNCMTLTRFILAEQKKYAPGGTGETRLCYCCYDGCVCSEYKVCHYVRVTTQ